MKTLYKQNSKTFDRFMKHKLKNKTNYDLFALAGYLKENTYIPAPEATQLAEAANN